MKTLTLIGRYLILGLTLVLSLPGAYADEVGELRARVGDLEERVRLLEAQLGSGAGASARRAGNREARADPPARPTPDFPAPEAQVTDPPPAGNPEPIREAEPRRAVGAQGQETPGAWARVYVLEDEGSLEPAQEPSVEGAVQFSGRVSFDPGEYGLESPRFFNSFDDPSLYPSVAVQLKGDWSVGAAGLYRLSIATKPAREGGGSVRSRLIFLIRVDGKVVVPETETARWQTIKSDVNLEPGVHRVEIVTLARSPGYGPSPIDSGLVIKVQGPGGAGFYPLNLTITPGNSTHPE